jgi:hypothetical protein
MGVTSTAAELNILDGVTSTAAELNILGGVTSTAAELNHVSGVTSAIQTQLDAKQASDADLTTLATNGIGTSANQLVQLNGSAELPAVSGANLINLPASGGVIEATASGTLANGNKVILKSDGTVEVVVETSTPVNQGAGTPVVFNSGTTYNPKSTFDSNLNKVVIVYKDGSNSNYGTCVVGTVSGTSISFGLEVVFNSGSTQHPTPTFDSNLNKVVIIFSMWPSDVGYGIVGTVSGTSISFGTATSFSSGVANGPMSTTFDSNSNKVVVLFPYSNPISNGVACVATVSGTSISFGGMTTLNSGATYHITSTFDSNSNKVVVAFKSTNDSNYGRSVVGTVSGTSISFGTEVTFSPTNTAYCAAAFDSNLNKVVIIYQDGGNSDYGTYVVGTVSGTSISFGTVGVFDSVGSVRDTSATFNSTANKVIFTYQGSDASTGWGDRGKVVAGTVSGTSMSFDTVVIFNHSESTKMSTTFDSNSNKVVIAYRDHGNSNYGEAVVWTTGYTIFGTNLTADNYIGISDGAYADTATATIQVVGATDDAQSGLTTGSKQYVQWDGTLSTTPGSPSVYAGVALSATKLLIKG